MRWKPRRTRYEWMGGPPYSVVQRNESVRAIRGPGGRRGRKRWQHAAKVDDRAWARMRARILAEATGPVDDEIPF